MKHVGNQSVVLSKASGQKSAELKIREGGAVTSEVASRQPYSSPTLTAEWECTAGSISCVPPT